MQHAAKTTLQNFADLLHRLLVLLAVITGVDSLAPTALLATAGDDLTSLSPVSALAAESFFTLDAVGFMNDSVELAVARRVLTGLPTDGAAELPRELDSRMLSVAVAVLVELVPEDEMRETSLLDKLK
jgi:hypothetical protein